MLTGTRRRFAPVITLAALALAAISCNLINSPPAATSTPPMATASGVPRVTVLWPPDGSEFLLRSEITVRVSAEDAVGITRLELRSPNAMLSSVPSPERNGQTSMEAILSWTPTVSGEQNLEVIAYRRGVASVRVPLRLVIRRRMAEVNATPVPFGVPTPAVSGPGTACRVRVDIDNLRYRSGPGTNTEILGLLTLGETLSVTGQNSARTWYRAARDNQTIWVSANPSYSTEMTSCAAAPVVN
jgi:uncharacterized protein YgiM (DUF1202 family)